jgi:pimeloyl-ACP methyl ester carboxylesterase
VAADSLKTTAIDGREIAYQDVGQGTTVILTHCSGASHRMWSRLVPALADRYRVLAPDLIGYGRSAAWPPDQPFDPRADVNVVRGFVDLADGPVHLAAHSYGAATSLEVARLMGRRIASLTLVEPVAFHLLRLAGRRAEWDEISVLAERVRASVDSGAYPEAAAVFTSYWAGRARWWLTPRRSRRAIAASIGKVAAEFSILRDASTTLDDYARIDAPTRLIVGGRTRRPARAVVDILLETLPNVQGRVIPRAGHMSPFTHPAEVHALMVEHIDLCEGQGSGEDGGPGER